MLSTELYQISEKDHQRVAALLAESFGKDPLYCQMIPDEELRKRILPKWFDCYLDMQKHCCEFYADSEEINGIISLVDDTRHHSVLDYALRVLKDDLRIGWRLVREDPSLRTLGRVLACRRFLTSGWESGIQNHNRIHIDLFAVRDSARGKGVGAGMMNAILREADKRHAMATLETHNSRNVGLYQHFGFRTYEVVGNRLPLKQYCMVRTYEVERAPLPLKQYRAVRT